MTGRDQYIRSSQEALLQEFAHDRLEQVHFRPFVLRSMQIACGFKTLYRQVMGRDCDLDADLKRLGPVAFEHITQDEIQKYCNGTLFHPEIKQLLDATGMFKGAGKKTPQEYENAMRALQGGFNAEKAAMLAGIDAPGRPLATLTVAVAENSKRIEALVNMRAMLDANMTYTNHMGLALLTLRQVKTDMEKKLTDQLAALTGLLIDPGTNMAPDTRTLLMEIKNARGGIGPVDSTAEEAHAAEVAILKDRISAMETEKLALKAENDEWGKFYTQAHAPLLKVMLSLLSTAVVLDPVEGKLKRPANAIAEINALKAVDPASVCPSLHVKNGSLTTEFKAACAALSNFDKACFFISTKINNFQAQWPASDPVISPMFEMSAIPSASVLQHLAPPLALCCVPTEVFCKMLSEHVTCLSKKSPRKIKWEICKKTTMPPAVPAAARWAGFSGMVFHIEGGSIRPCHPDICHPLLYSTVLSHLNMVLAEAKSSAAMAMANGVLEMCQLLHKDNPTVYADNFKNTESTFAGLLEQKLLNVAGAKSEEDAPLLALLLQLVSLTSQQRLYLTYNDPLDTTALKVIHPDEIDALKEAVCNMIYNIDKHARILNGVTDSTSVDEAYRQMFTAFGFAADQMTRACTHA